MDDPYLNELKYDFDAYSNQLKKLKAKLLKSNFRDVVSILINFVISCHWLHSNQKLECNRIGHVSQFYKIKAMVKELENRRQRLHCVIFAFDFLIL